MDPFTIRQGPLLDVIRGDGMVICETASFDQLADAIGFYVNISNSSGSHLWIDNIYFATGPSYDQRNLNPIFPNRSQAYPFRLPVDLRSGFSIEYAVAFNQIPEMISRATGISIRYRNYYMPFPLYKSFDFSDEGFKKFIKAFQMRLTAKE
jgi:hypothetical protein